jgi:hypothetical protein
MLLPHPSETVPHSAAALAQDVGVQPQAFDFPLPPQLSGGVQLPQSSTLLHPSDTLPQFALTCWQVLGMQGVLPHWFGPAPPQNNESSQPPQSRTPSHPSGA